MNTARSAIRVSALASIVATAALTVTETPCQVTQSWATIVDDGARFEMGRYLALDPAGNAIVGSASPGPPGGPGFRLTKIDPAGTVIWSQRFASAAPGGGLSIVGLAVDGAGDILSVCREGDPNGNRALTVKVSGDGKELWRAVYDTDGADWPVGIEADAAGRSFVGGWTQRFEPTQALENAFILSYDADGNLLWQDQYGSGKNQETINDIARDPVSGAVYLAGDLNGSVPLLLRYEADGRRRWARRYQSHAVQAYAERVAVGPDGVVLAGFYAGRGVGIQVIKVDAASGRSLWSAVYGEATTYEQLIDVAIDGSGNVLVAGAAETEPPIVRFLGLFLLRYAPDGTLSWAVTDDRIGAFHGALAVDPSGSPYVTGTRQVRVDNFFTQHWLTSRYDTTGQLVWTIEYDGNPGGLTGGISQDLALTSAGDVIVIGDVTGDVHAVSYREP